MQTGEKLVKLEMADGTFEADPDAVASVKAAADRTEGWSVITMLDGHQAVVKGNVEDVAKQLGRSH